MGCCLSCCLSWLSFSAGSSFLLLPHLLVLLLTKTKWIKSYLPTDDLTLLFFLFFVSPWRFTSLYPIFFKAMSTSPESESFSYVCTFSSQLDILSFQLSHFLVATLQFISHLCFLTLFFLLSPFHFSSRHNVTQLNCPSPLIILTYLCLHLPPFLPF